MNDSDELVGVANKDRFFAAVCDNVLAFIVAALIAAAIGTLGELIPTLVMVVAYFAYFLVTEGVLGTTPGKLLCGLRVKTLSGGRCTWRHAAIRTACRLIEVDPILLGGLPAGIVILTTSRRQRLGDLLAGTVVVPR